MAWLGQKSEPEFPRPIPPVAATSSEIPSHPAPTAVGVRTEAPKVASIGKSLHVRGELTGNEDLAVEGKVEGTIALKGHHLTIGPTGHATAGIQAKSVVVGGQVNGNVSADEKVEISATGSIVGDVRAPRVVLVDGARFKGRIDMG